ncbi:hypothetical protein FJT64_009690 [Amphibalanus amphitrite]|uniref:Uncharacterized protein n=1 Tax=Amphibalanus amphitrite TaxID=1232801 RepID=A0A6A4VNJ0_AMPAM|nr:hypothetical protein FJT64_009690 [Amphibalanus amphitrite]
MASKTQDRPDVNPHEPIPSTSQGGKTRVFNQSRKPKRAKPPKPSKPQVTTGPKVLAPLEVPKPQHLNAKGTALASDPLWQDAFVLEGDKGYVQVPKKRTFGVTAEGLYDITSAVYNEICAVDGSVRKTIPKSAFEYHATILLHARFAELRKRHGYDSTYGELRFVETMKEFGPVPEAQEAYYRSFGDLPDVAGVEYKLVL